MDFLAKFGGEPREVEDVDRKSLLSKTGSASLTSRQVFDISPGQVCSLRDEPLISRIRGGSLKSS
jgi:hypothetical protein